MAQDVVKLYISLISEFFRLSDVAVMTSVGGSYDPASFPLIPKNTHSPCTAHYLIKIHADIQDTVNELNGLEISQDNGLKSFLESVKWRFEDILIDGWLRGVYIHLPSPSIRISIRTISNFLPSKSRHDLDAHILHWTEAWVTSSNNAFTTCYPSQIEAFQRHMTTAAFKLAGGLDPSVSRPQKQVPIPQIFVLKITKAFLDALYAILDGMVLLASDESPVVGGKAPAPSDSILEGSNSMDLLDLKDGVSKEDHNLIPID